MKTAFRLGLVLAGCSLAAAVGARTAGDIASGPAAGTMLPALKVDAVTGPNAGKELDYLAARKDTPTVYILVRNFDPPVARFMKILDGALPEESAKAASVAIWLTDDKQPTKEYLPKVQQSLKMENTAMGVFPGDKVGPDGWGVNPQANVTVIVAAGPKVVSSFGYLSINDTHVGEVRAALKKAASP